MFYSYSEVGQPGVPDGLITHRSVVQIHSSLPFLLNFLSWIKLQDLTDSYKTAISSKIRIILSKSMYKNPELYLVLLKRVSKNNLDKYSVLAIRMFLKYLEFNNLFFSEQLEKLRKPLKSHRSNPDMFVPTDEQILSTLQGLSYENRLIYSMFLFSGLRNVEIQQILKDWDKLEVQQMEGFVKIKLTSYRNTKNSFFCYLPLDFYNILKEKISD